MQQPGEEREKHPGSNASQAADDREGTLLRSEACSAAQYGPAFNEPDCLSPPVKFGKRICQGQDGDRGTQLQRPFGAPAWFMHHRVNLHFTGNEGLNEAFNKGCDCEQPHDTNLLVQSFLGTCTIRISNEEP